MIRVGRRKGGFERERAFPLGEFEGKRLVEGEGLQGTRSPQLRKRDGIDTLTIFVNASQPLMKFFLDAEFS